MLNATATALVSKFSGRNPKIITRWPYNVTTARRKRSTIPARPAAEVKRQAKWLPKIEPPPAAVFQTVEAL